MQIDVSVVLNLHVEGFLALPSVRSVRQNIETASAAGLAVEWIVILDRPDGATTELANTLEGEATIVTTDVGDLGSARNLGVANAQGAFVCFLDGDDLWCSDWIPKAFSVGSQNPNWIMHPLLNFYFSPGRVAREIFVHQSSLDERFQPDLMRFSNPWTSLSFGAVSIYKAHPYAEVDLDEGWGYEDWNWNMRTLNSKHDHVVVPETVHYVRRKPANSLLSASNSGGTWVQPSKAFHYQSQNSRFGTPDVRFVPVASAAAER